MMVRIHVFLLPKMSSCWRKFAVTGTSLSSVNARIAAMIAHGTKNQATLWTHRADWFAASRCGAMKPMPSSVKPISQGAMSWIRDMPKLPMPACRPSAVPDMRLGKK